LVPPLIELVLAPLSFPNLEPLLMINVNKGSLSISCKAIARLFIASMIACYLDNRICARVLYESRSLLVSLDDSKGKNDGLEMGGVSVIFS